MNHRNGRTSRFNRISRRAIPALALLVAVASGCSTLGQRGKQLVPTNHRYRTGPFVFSSDFELKKESPEVAGLESLEREMAKSLDLELSENDPTIEIYILNDRESFSHFLKFYYPELPSRRAFFLAQGESRVVYTYKGPKLEEDLRHEATHALLNLRFGDLPLWLDEGLAEYFEVVDPAQAGSHEHLDALANDLKGGWTPDLVRLEGLTDIRHMTPRDYRESWAWVYSMLNRSTAARSTVLAFLRDPPESRAESRLSARLRQGGVDLSGDSLIAYMNSQRSRQAGRSQPLAKTRVVRLQDRGQDMPTPVEPPKGIVRGLFRRMGSLFGF